ncbi:helix-turn-helix domain-containing protein [Aliikangiella sp. IMCC44359]|uniref:helix-turn-helix domain-containing protein n=1 Tax=Aliikangiella sp. IMCC44359 TaxID=3459125 RepID=UPI00403AB358
MNDYKSLNEVKYSSFNHALSVKEVRSKALSKGIVWAEYAQSNDYIHYCNSQQHTLRLYLDGDYTSNQKNNSISSGSLGLICLLPKGSSSSWKVTPNESIIHLYFSDSYIKQLAVTIFDIDPRALSLPEIIYLENKVLENKIRNSIYNKNWQALQDNFILEHSTQKILVTLLKEINIKQFSTVIKGGLSPKIMNDVCQFIQTNFHRQIFLAELSAISGLSDFHFCRMFKQSTAQTPQEYLLNIRINKVKELLLSSKQSLSDISLKCGFSNQSHMGRYFKKFTGVSPSIFRKNTLNHSPQFLYKK